MSLWDRTSRAFRVFRPLDPFLFLLLPLLDCRWLWVLIEFAAMPTCGSHCRACIMFHGAATSATWFLVLISCGYFLDSFGSISIDFPFDGLRLYGSLFV